MMNRPIEGMVIAATLKGSAFGQRIYHGVTLRRRDGVEQQLGGVMVAARLGDALTPGREGRFYFHDIMGSQGLHAYQPAGAAAAVAFPRLVERLFALLAVLNLGLVGGWIAAEGGLQLVPLTLGVLGTMAWATFRGCREAILHDFKHESRVAASRSHRHAVLRGHA